jgi:hypothetical protein
LNQRGTFAQCEELSAVQPTYQEDFVKKLAFIAAAALVALTVPASAQGVSIGVGDARVGVGVDRPHYQHRRDHWDSRAHYRDRDEVVVIKKKRHEPRRKTVIIER